MVGKTYLYIYVGRDKEKVRTRDIHKMQRNRDRIGRERERKTRETKREIEEEK